MGLGSPAEAGGLKVGDIVTGLATPPEKIEARTPEELAEVLEGHSPGANVTLTVYRSYIRGYDDGNVYVRLGDQDG